MDVIKSGSDLAISSDGAHPLRSPVKIIAGVVCGVILACVVSAVWYIRRRKQRLQSVDLLDLPLNLSEVPPAGYGPANGGPGWASTAATCRQVLADSAVNKGAANHPQLIYLVNRV